jgi:hypothetical protein
MTKQFAYMETSINNHKPKKNIKATLYEALSIILFLLVIGNALKKHDITELSTWGILPLIPFIISILYRSEEIGNNIKKVGLTFASVFAYLNNIGINGLPALAIMVLLGLFIANFFSTEKVWSEMIKIVGGIASGSLAQARITKRQAIRISKSTKKR